jgi:hypothetical protein
MSLARSGDQASGRTSVFKQVVWPILLLNKSLVLLAVVAAVSFAEFDTREFLAAYAQWPAGATVPSLSSRLGAWDAAHYLILSEQGYQAGSHSCAFYPLWPAAIRATTFLTFGSPLIAGLLLANALSLAALWLFYRLVEPRCGAEIARDALILMLASPGALFLSFPYTESLYLAIVLVFLLGLERHRYFWPCLMAFLAPLTKAIGVFLVLPLAWHLFEQRKPLKYWFLLVAPMLGYAAYFGLMFAWTGNAFEGFEAQKAYPYSPSIRNMFDWHGFSSAFLDMQSLDGMTNSGLDRGFFILFLVLLPLMYRLNKTWFLCSLPAGLMPAMASYFMSYRRYITICFPVFIILAQLLAKTKSRWLFWYYAALLAGLQVWALKQFTCFKWAG